jgi:methionine-rich copper-binding protein CopC
MSRRIAICAAVCLTILLAPPVRTAHAQPELINASPTPDSTWAASPGEVALVFDSPLDPRLLFLIVINQAGERVDGGDAAIDRDDPARVRVSLPTLPEGEYFVSYAVAELSPVDPPSFDSGGSYRFTIATPPPTLQLIEPVGGQGFPTGDIPLKTRTDFFELALPDNQILIYVDGDLRARLNRNDYLIEGLEPGVHELRVVLSQGGQELPETEIITYIAVGLPDPEAEGRRLAAIAPPDPGLQLTPLQLIGVLIGAGLALAAGLWLGGAFPRQEG